MTESLRAAGAAREVLERTERGEVVGIVTMIGGSDPTAAGLRLVLADGSRLGTLGSPEFDTAAERAALNRRERDEPGVIRIDVGAEEISLYVEWHRRRPELLVVGAGHIARPLARIGDLIGFDVTVIDDRDEFANEAAFPDARRVLVIDFADPFIGIEIRDDTHIVLVTRAHEYDYDCIKALLQMETRSAYVGMIGSRRRVRAAFEALIADGIDPVRLEDVRAPIGLDIGAETPEEIALAIAAELIATRRGGSAGSLTEAERVLDRVARKMKTAGESGRAHG